MQGQGSPMTQMWERLWMLPCLRCHHPSFDLSLFIASSGLSQSRIAHILATSSWHAWACSIGKATKPDNSVQGNCSGCMNAIMQCTKSTGDCH
eukprot:1142646-Pelagomonas_calceolata.AAC.2